MGFRENLKAELTYKDMRVKELAGLSGVKKQTVDSYLRENGCVPSVDAALNIARALGVSVEYLVTGKEEQKTQVFSPPKLYLFMQSLKQLNEEEQKIVINNALNLAESLKNKGKNNQ
jgi:transcriptional regulator with XRE-family HTH domain